MGPEVIVPDTSPLIHLAAVGALRLLGRFGRVIVVDMVAFEATHAGRPWADEIAAWLEQGRKAGSNNPVEIAETEIGRAFHLARKTEPTFTLRNGGETAIVQWLGEHVSEITGAALVVYENGRVPNTIRREGVNADIAVLTTRALLELAEQQGAIESAEELWRMIEQQAPTANPLSATMRLRRSGPYSRF